jgi:dihydrofolate reductase
MKLSALSILLFLPLFSGCGKDNPDDGTDTGETGETGETGNFNNEIQSLDFSSPAPGSVFAPGEQIRPTAEVAGNYKVENLSVALRVDSETITDFDFTAGELSFDFSVGVGEQVAILEISDDTTTHHTEISWIGNTPPTVVLEDLGDLNQGEPLTITGVVSDGESSPEDLVLTWFFDGVDMGPATADTDGNVSYFIEATPSGSHTLQLVAEDQWASASDSVDLEALCTLSSSIQTLIHLNEKNIDPKDSSMNDVDIQVLGAATIVSGAEGNALDLGGESYIAILNPAYPALWTTNFTVAGWVNPNGTPTGAQTIFQQLDGTGLARTMLYQNPGCGGALSSYIGALSLCGTTPLQAGTWQHVALTRNRDTGKVALFLNGVKEAEGDRLMEFADGELVIGVGKTLSTQFFDGAVDDLVVLSEALDEADVADLFNGGAPICNGECVDLPQEAYHWFDGTAGSTNNLDMEDLMGNANANLLGGAGFGPGTHDDGLLLDGIAGYAELEAGQALELSSTDFTISLRVRFDGSSLTEGDHSLIQQLDGDGLGRTMIYVDATCGGQVSSFIGGQELCSGNLTPGLWHHIVFRVNQTDNTAQFFVDGIAKQIASREMVASNGGIRIGGGKTLNGQFWDGMIDDLLIFDSALSDEEIIGLHEAGTNYCPVE